MYLERIRDCFCFIPRPGRLTGPVRIAITAGLVAVVLCRVATKNAIVNCCDDVNEILGFP